MKKLKITFVGCCVGIGVFASEVVQVTSNPRIVGISSNAGETYTVGEKVCFERQGQGLGCGTVTRLFKKGAAVQLEEGVLVEVGDSLSGRAPASLMEAPTVDSSSTQTIPPTPQKIYGKINVGFNRPEYTTTSSSYSKLFSYLIGIGAEIPLTPAISLEPSIFYSPEWVAATYSTVTARVEVSYLEIPIYLKWRPFYKKPTKLSPFVLVGPSYGYLLSARLTYEGLDTPPTDYTQLLNSSRFSLNAGLGFDTQISETLSLGVSLRYLMAISSPTRNNAGSSSSAQLIQGLVALGWDYESDILED